MNVYLKNVIVVVLGLFAVSLLMCHPTLAGSSTQLGSRWDLSPDEIDLESRVTQNIALYSAIGGYNTYNYYGSETTRDNIYLAANGMGTIGSLAFYTGHAYNGYVWNYHWLYGWMYEQQWNVYEDAGGMVYDKDIFPYSASQNVKFVFLYGCTLGDTIGGTHWSETPFGMPYAWLHTTSLSSDGYCDPDSGNQVFLGFHLGAPQFYTGNINHNFLGFVTGFYYAALCNGWNYTVKQALDYAATQYSSSCHSFSDTDLYQGIYDYVYHPELGHTVYELTSQMKVYGDGNIHLSAAMPTIAMKTKVDGNFYMPSGPPPTYTGVQIYQLFDNIGIAGDQKGATPPYTSLSNYYPDGQVDIFDALFVGGKLGKSEGQSGWEYMADVVPNRVIDIFDCIVISNNNGKSGTYMTDLTDVTVTFSVPGGPIQESVDSHGFVTIPLGTTSFTVKRSGNAIGAVAIFWSRV